jgi:hypothetical protein
MDETPPIKEPSPEQLQTAFKEIAALAKNGHPAAALVTGWAALESLARLASAKSGAKNPRGVSPLQAIQRLAEGQSMRPALDIVVLAHSGAAVKSRINSIMTSAANTSPNRYRRDKMKTWRRAVYLAVLRPSGSARILAAPCVNLAASGTKNLGWSGGVDVGVIRSRNSATTPRTADGGAHRRNGFHERSK